MVYIFYMREVNLAGFDLNLLPPLQALLVRKNVTHAANDVGLSQPAMSRALARLRDLLGDPLLVRAAKGFRLTPRAEALLPLVTAALADVKTVFRPPAFEPATAERTIRFAASDVQTVLIAPLLQGTMRREAPGIDLRFETYGRDVVTRIEDGRLDFAFALASSPLPPGAASFALAEDRLALVMRYGHPLAHRPWTVHDYGSVDHVGVSLTDDGLSELDAKLASYGVTRRMVMTAPHFVAALAAVAASDAVTTISRRYARRFSDLFGLEIRDPPFEQTKMTIVLVTSAVRAHDPLLLWIVEKTRQATEVAYRESAI